MLKQGGLFAPISREGALVLNNLLLTTSCATVFFGTLYPLALEQLTGEKITVGAPFFNMTCGVLLLALAFVTPFGFSLAWKRGDLLGVAQRLAVAFAGGSSSSSRCLAFYAAARCWRRSPPALAVFVMLGTLTEVVSRAWRRGAFARRRAVARARAAAVVLGRRARAFRRRHGPARPRRRPASAPRRSPRCAVGAPQTVGPYEVMLDSVGERGGPNYRGDGRRR